MLQNKIVNSEMTSKEILVMKLRMWQMEINEGLKRKRFKVPVHLGLGTESLVVAVSSIVLHDDNLVLTHRNAAFNLVRASSQRQVVMEYELNEHGTSFGQLGSMNLSNPDAGVVYSSSILGNNISVACGFAFAQQMSGCDAITVVLTGDGAIEEGAFYEGLVFAKSHNLPLVVVVDNNDYSMASAISQRRCDIDLEHFCKAVGVAYYKLSGNDVEAYGNEFSQLSKDTRKIHSQSVVEVFTTLLNQHAGPTPGWPSDPFRVDFSGGLVIRKDISDPVFVLREKYGHDIFASIESEILATQSFMDQQ